MSCFSAVSAFAQSEDAEVVPDELIVKMKGVANGEHSRRVFRRLQGRVHLKHSTKALNMHHMKVTDGTSAADLIDELNQNPDVEYAEPNYVLHMSSSSYSQVVNSYNQGQAYVSVSNQVTQSWGILTGHTKVVVAVLDTGVDLVHNVFTSTSGVWVNPGETGTDSLGRNKASNGVDDDGNGFIDDVNGWNFAYGSNSPSDDNGHGTHVSGIVLGLGQNILPGATLTTSKIQIMPLKFMDSSGSGSTAQAVQAIDYAINNGARILNNSWGGSGYSQSLNDALTYAYNRGLFIASAAGNYSTNDDSSPLYPASLSIPSQMTVAATGSTDGLSSYSSYGSNSVQIGAPGDNVESTYTGGGFAYLSGTSMATPFISGVAALILIESPQLTGYQVKQIIMNSVDNDSSLQGRVSTSGRVNVYAAVQLSNNSSSTQSYQPAYVEQLPSGVSSGTQTTTGCGTVSASLLDSSFWSQGGGSGGSSPQALGLLLGFLMMPLAVWFIVRSRLVSRQRRKHDRFVFNSEVRVQVDGRELVGKLTTIGAGGISFNADQMLAKGGLVTMHIQSPNGGEQIQVAGRIVWAEKEAHGVQFGPIGDSLLEKIRLWTRDLAKAA